MESSQKVVTPDSEAFKDLSTRLASEAIQSVGGTIPAVSPQLSIDNPESIQHFTLLGDLLAKAYLQGQANASVLEAELVKDGHRFRNQYASEYQQELVQLELRAFYVPEKERDINWWREQFDLMVAQRGQ